ncbi:MAG: DEAD/DEAH box helicase [Gammaproteobacteria bacterium]|nr:DEAD/DEAH box helicase [Gammaproteobacteria bacterium]
MSKPDLLSTLERLSAPAYAIALVYGVCYPIPPGQARILKWLTESGLLDQHSTHGTDLRSMVAELLRLGVIRQANQTNVFIADPDASTYLIRQAERDGILAPLLQRLSREPYFAEWNLAEPATVMFTRAALLTGRIDYLRFCRRRIPWKLLLLPEMQRSIVLLPIEQAEQALAECLEACEQKVRNIDFLLDATESRDKLTTDMLAQVAWLRCLQGRFDHVLNWLHQQSQTQGGRVVEAATRALVSFLRGDDEGALAWIQKCLAESRGATRKRRIFPDYSVFTLSLLALVRLKKPEAEDLFFELLNNASQLRCTSTPLSLIGAAALYLRGQNDLAYGHFGDQHDLLTLMLSLRLTWNGQIKDQKSRSFQHVLRGITTRLQDTGFDWLLAEFQSILTADVEGGITRIHQRLRCTPLIHAIPAVEEWEVGLGALEALARSVQRKTGDKPDLKRESRIAWEVIKRSDSEFEITPREQHLTRGRWSKGRGLSLTKLRTGTVDPNLLTPRDQAAGAHIKSVTSRGRNESLYVDIAALTELIGHHHVVDGDGNALEVYAAEPTLIIDELMGGELKATLTPWPEEEHPVQIIYRRGDHRLGVLQLTDGMRTLRGVIPQEGLRLPAFARGRLMDVVSTLAGEIKIHSSIEGTAASARNVDADPLPWVQLTPAGSGLNVRLLTEPLPGSLLQFDPGSGTELVFAEVETERQQTRRNLVAEHDAAVALITACPTLTDIDHNNWRIELIAPEDCLELLEQLRESEVRCLWPQGQNYRVLGRAGAASLTVKVKSSAEWFAASGELKVDEDHAISLARLMMLLEENPRSRFIRVGEGEYIALSKSFRKQLDTLRSVTSTRGQTVRLNPLAAHALEDLFDESTLDADDSWQEQQARLRDAHAFEPALPATLQAELRPYQEDGVRWLARLAAWGVGACLADDMGLGKTVQTLGLLLLRAGEGPGLVIAPTSLVDNWRNEAHRFAPTLNIIVHAGTVSDRQNLLDSLKPFDVVITTYGVLQNDIERFEQMEWNVLVIDEAQAIKNASTKRAQAARALRGRFRLATTGTPIQNNLMDLYSLFSFLNPGLLGSAEHFRSLYALPIERDEDADARTRLARLIAPFILRRTKAEVLNDLPSRTEIVHAVTLSPEEAQFYEALRRQALSVLEGIDLNDGGPKQIQVLAWLTRLRLACCHPRLVHDTGIRKSAKHAEFMELLNELLQGRHKVLVFSQFVKHLKIIEKLLVSAGISYQYLDGETPREERTRRVSAFQSGEGDVFLISLKAGGTGLNLTAADYVIHMDPWWNPAAEDQASDRAHRIGQTRPVTIYRLVAKGTIEEQIVDLHHRKRDLADRLLEGADSSARLDVNELLALLRSGPDEQ